MQKKLMLLAVLGVIAYYLLRKKPEGNKAFNLADKSQGVPYYLAPNSVGV